MLTEEANTAYQTWFERRVAPHDRDRWPSIPKAPYAWPSDQQGGSKGTVVCLARDSAGDIAAGASTSGWAYKYPGRLSDSGIIGAGVYADNRYGACACTHTGEIAIRSGTARSVVLYMKRGASVRDACYEAAEDLDRLSRGYLGPLVIHALDRQEETFVLGKGTFKEIPS